MLKRQKEAYFFEINLPTAYMVKLPSSKPSSSTMSISDLLLPGENIAIVDDSPEIVLLLSHYVSKHNFPVVHAGSAKELYSLLEKQQIALLLLDIELPDIDGNDILKEIAPSHPDLAIIMVTGTLDIQIALDCIRLGADDYLPKPVFREQFDHTLINTLKKRRLAINNRLYQEELQKTNAQLHFLHNLNQIMNSAYLSAVELKSVLRAILFGLTSFEGLRFNRAFLALFDDSQTFLCGELGVTAADSNPSSTNKNISLFDVLNLISSQEIDSSIQPDNSIRSLKISVRQKDHILLQAIQQRRAIHVTSSDKSWCRVPPDLQTLLGVDSFVAVPLYSPLRELGVILVDNSISKKQITATDITGLEIFAGHASLAIEQGSLYAEMLQKIDQLEEVSEELEKNKDLLIDAERRVALGNMSAQLLHSIRNPITAIGSTSRLLKRKTKDSYSMDFLSLITEEANKIENILEDITSFTEETPLVLTPHPVFPLLRKSLMVFYVKMKKNNIRYHLDLRGESPVLLLDETRMRQVFLHLIKNSIEAMATGGNFEISAATDNALLHLSFRDSGPGIPESNLPYVKDPFYTTKTYGNGMGLTLVEQVIASHHGFFTIEGVSGGGTRATVSLPLRSAAGRVEK